MKLSYQKSKNLELANEKEFLEKVSEIAKEKGLPFAKYDNFLQVGPVQFYYLSHKYKNVITCEERVGINGFIVYLRDFVVDNQSQNYLYSTKSVKDKTNKKIIENWLNANGYMYTFDPKQGSFRIDEYTIYRGVNIFKKGKKVGSGFSEIERELQYLEPEVPIKDIVLEVTKLEDYKEI
ncbi:hypothetical protein [Clostridium sp.]|uniref:hypothetical protein n=1 Tax=Clostridium sp. TaxID=1506 RepID=UPI001B757DD6|nr:hypothetical protein [Clostridium sp.]MBP3916603.1 hypothetical protein [Clostridium sp.]